jgi:hypothetical protein
MTSWRPSRREERAIWWLRQATRYGLGGGGLIYEVTVDRLHNELALLAFFLLAMGGDVTRIARGLLTEVREEQRRERETLEQLRQDQEELDQLRAERERERRDRE